MSSRILTTSVTGIDAFMHDPRGVLANAEGGTVAVFADNTPAFYAITPQRLAQLLELEARLSRPTSDVTLDTQFFDEPTSAPVAVPMGKFAMYNGWQPDPDFNARQRCGASPSPSLLPRKSWPPSPLTGRRKEKSSIISSGSKSWRAACRSTGPAAAGHKNAILTPFPNRIIRSHRDSEGDMKKRR